jgi:hypothetical protein
MAGAGSATGIARLAAAMARVNLRMISAPHQIL